MTINVEKTKANIIKLLGLLKDETKDKAKVRGIENLIKYLCDTDFFTAPTSTRFHLACEGGLAYHSLNVYKRLHTEFTQEAKAKTGTDKIDSDIKYSLIICSICHDLCKVNFYEKGKRNVKNPDTGKWEEVPTYNVKDQLILGHGEKSLYICQKLGVVLTDEEAMAIRWHMGGFDNAVKGGAFGLSEVYDNSMLALLLHIADMKASHIDEVE